MCELREPSIKNPDYQLGLLPAVDLRPAKHPNGAIRSGADLPLPQDLRVRKCVSQNQKVSERRDMNQGNGSDSASGPERLNKSDIKVIALPQHHAEPAKLGGFIFSIVDAVFNWTTRTRTHAPQRIITAAVRVQSTVGCHCWGAQRYACQSFQLQL